MVDRFHVSSRIGLSMEKTLSSDATLEELSFNGGLFKFTDNVDKLFMFAGFACMNHMNPHSSNFTKLMFLEHSSYSDITFKFKKKTNKQKPITPKYLSNP